MRSVADFDSGTQISRLEAFPYWQDFGIVMLLVVLASVLGLIARTSWSVTVRSILLPGVSLGWTGLAIGLLVGNSLTPLGGTGLSGLLTLGGGFVVYLMGRDGSATNQAVGEEPPATQWQPVAAAVALAMLSVSMIYGASISSVHRMQIESFSKRDSISLDQQGKNFDAQVEIWKYREKKVLDAAADSAAKANH